VPSGGGPRGLEAPSGQQQAFAQPIPPPPPGPSWTPLEVVLGFLAASASFELDPAAARQYLAPGVQWLNSPQTSPPDVTVVTGWQERPVPGVSLRLAGGERAQAVTIKGDRLASLGGDGYYEYQPGPANYTFVLENSGGTWLIQQLPGRNLLLLTQALFEQVFQPRDLYFFGPLDTPSQNFLVPDPVFVPLQDPAAAANPTSLAAELVQGLLVVNERQQTWLSSATATAFPAGTTLSRQGGVTISNLTARVSLQIPGGSTQALADQMYAQLYETLTSSAYNSPQIVKYVDLIINGKPQQVSMAGATVPAVGSAHESLYFGAAGLIGQWSYGPTSTVATPDPLAPGAQVDAVAVSRGSRPSLAVAVPYEKGCAVYVGAENQSTGFATYRLSRSGGGCTSLSWDSYGHLWVVAGSNIWLVEQGQAPVTVAPPTSAPVLALQMAPDGVRAAFLVHTQHGNEMLLAAATYGINGWTFGSFRPVGSTLANPTAMAWYQPDDLIALDGSALYQVPLTGGISQELVPVPSQTVSVSTAGSANALAVRTASGMIYTWSAANDQWTPVRDLGAPVQAGPAYPG
jgi:hypothetical protein